MTRHAHHDPSYQSMTDRIFAENLAAVCPLGEWLPDETMQAVASTAHNTHLPLRRICRLGLANALGVRLTERR